MFKKELNINSRESTEVIMVSDHSSDTQRNTAVKEKKIKLKKPKKTQSRFGSQS